MRFAVLHRAFLTQGNTSPIVDDELSFFATPLALVVVVVVVAVVVG
jgi:hypothetical protein